uniref:Bestrophin family protein n=1 Tax=Roseihalotalea indica TaxID=2867963 RepID=A0AA49JFN4_9BACT|nr:bestrophin family protein [Tunicatimonas sp. TK19036]
MVRYNSKQWLRSLRNFYLSYTLQLLLRTVLWVGVFTTVVCVAMLEILHWEPRLTSGFFSLLGIVLSILLVFRTNTAYDRWWEGRKQWGALVNNCRNLAVMFQAILPVEDTSNRKYFAKHISNFCLSLVEHLRNGTKVEQLIHLTGEEQIIYGSKDHLPSFIVLQIFQRTQNLYTQGIFSDSDMINLKPQIQSLLDILGACERIKKTPIPFSYSVYIKTFIIAYCAFLPFGLIDEFQYYTIPLVMFVFFAMAGVEFIGEEIEDPFGLDCNDLPTGTIAQTIKNNVHEILCLFSEVEQRQEEKLYEKVF